MKVINIRHEFSDEEWAELKKYFKEREVREALHDDALEGLEHSLRTRRGDEFRDGEYV